VRVSDDELAGVVELFGGLTRDELRQALSEVAYRMGEEFDGAGVDTSIDEALNQFYLVRFESEERTLLVDGPRAFPELPPQGEDLPHIMDVEPRTVDRDELGRRVNDQLATEVTLALAGADEDRMRTLVDVSYDAEAWAPVDCSGVRARLDAVL
jgi:hypothetical protein